MPVEYPDDMDTAEMEEPQAPSISPLPANDASPSLFSNTVFSDSTTWDDALSNVSETTVIEDQNMFEKNPSEKMSKDDEQCGHLTSHCCVSNGNGEEIDSSRNSSDSGVGVNMETKVGFFADKKILETENLIVSNEDNRDLEQIKIFKFQNSSTVYDNINSNSSQLQPDENKDRGTDCLINERIDNEKENSDMLDPTKIKLLDTLNVSEDFRMSETNDCLKLDLAEKGSIKLIGCHVLKYIIESREPIDTVISCIGGKIGGHRVILAAASPFFKELFQDHRLGEVAVVILPDISVKIMEIVLNLCYTGKTNIPKILENEVYEAIGCLMIGPSAEFSLKEVTVKIRPPPVPIPLSEPVHQENANLFPEPATEGTSSKSDDIVNVTNDVDNSSQLEIQNSIPNSPTPSTSHGSQMIPVSGFLLQDSKYRCFLCPTVWSSKPSFARHLMKVHKRPFHSVDVPIDDLDMLSYCSICDKHHTNVNMAAKCDKTHKLGRCWTCLGMFPIDDILKHYRSVHGINTEEGIAIKCRWCDIVIRATNTYGIIKHSSVHIPSSNVPKRSLQETPKKATAAGNKKHAPSVLPFLTRFVQNLEAQDSNVARSTSKKRKLDDNGKPLQLAQRTGVPVGRRKQLKILSPSKQYNPGTFSISTDTKGKVPAVKILQLPEIQVHLDFISETEIDKHMYKSFYDQLSLKKRKEENVDVDKGESNDTTLLTVILNEITGRIEKHIPETECAVEVVEDSPVQFVNQTIKNINCTDVESIQKTANNKIDLGTTLATTLTTDSINRTETTTQILEENCIIKNPRQDTVQRLQDSSVVYDNQNSPVIHENNAFMDTQIVSVDNTRPINDNDADMELLNRIRVNVSDEKENHKGSNADKVGNKLYVYDYVPCELSEGKTDF